MLPLFPAYHIVTTVNDCLLKSEASVYTFDELRIQRRKELKTDRNFVGVFSHPLRHTLCFSSLLMVIECRERLTVRPSLRNLNNIIYSACTHKYKIHMCRKY